MIWAYYRVSTDLTDAVQCGVAIQEIKEIDLVGTSTKGE